MSTAGEPVSPKPSSFALLVLVILTVLSPWPFGSVSPVAVRAITIVGLAACALVFAWSSVSEGLRLPDLPLLPLVAVAALGLLQLAPLPLGLHAVLAPASYAVWHPSVPAASDVLGSGPHPVSLDPVATSRAVLLLSALVGLALLAAPALTRVPTAIVSVATVAAGGTAVAVYGILARARFGSLLYGHIAVPTVSPFGPYVSKNHFASYAGMAALLALGLTVGLASRRARSGWTTGGRGGGVVLALVSALAMSLGVLVSLSRGGAISLALGLLAFAAVRWTQRRGGAGGRPVLPSLAVAAAVAVLLLLVLPSEAHDRLRSLAGASFRFDTWRDTLRMVPSSPWVGQGLGSFEDAYPRFKQGHGELRVEHAENDYLETLAEAGLAGFALILAALFVSARRILAAPPSSVLGGLGAGGLGGLAALLAHSAFDFNLRIPSNAILAAFLVSVAAASVPARPVPRWAAGLSAVIFGGAALFALMRPALADPSVRWQKARAEARLAAASVAPEARTLRLERTESALRETLRGRPAHAEAWLLLAGLWHERGDPSAPDLARHAVGLDPTRPDLRAAADAIGR